MKPAFVKKNTSGGAAGLSWKAGEVKALNPYLAEELVILAPDDYEIVEEDKTEEVEPELFKEDEATAEGLAEHLNEVPALLGKVFPTSTEKPTKPKRPVKNSNKNTETPSAE